MKAILTNKKDPTMKVEYVNPLNISVQRYINPESGYDSTPVWVVELGSKYGYGCASFHCSAWDIEIE